MNPGDTEQVVDGNDLFRGDPGLHPIGADPPAPGGPLPVDPDAPAPDERDLRRSALAVPARARARRSPPWRILAAIFVGGFAGGLARYEIGLAFPAPRGAFPAATFAINVSGSFVLALLVVYVTEIWPPTRYVRPLLAVGFCGAYTTFSTWMVGVDQLVADGRAGVAAGYLFGSLVAGLAATSLGLTVGRAVIAHRRRVERLVRAAEERP